MFHLIKANEVIRINYLITSGSDYAHELTSNMF